ncbi:asparaginase [Marinimicrococcus flavescens]|uniref:Asparaginase n=1 Tax=Marinimicrococcus flavescens TaxID=3031815 RepID=A0AAP3XPN7_9PROT|nr:asparaginase [Marinimicrococcus flavescens]
MRRVIILGTGGTIASRIDHAKGHVAAAASGSELLNSLTERGFALPDGVRVEVEQFCNVGSFLFDLDLAFRLAQRAATLLAEPDVAGVVVTHGTDTMEESAYLADLVIDSEKPVVFTGAQRHADEPDADGPRNLADAIRVAASPTARGLGAVIVFASEIHGARDVTKLHTSRLGTFQSAEHGKLGDVDEGRVVVRQRPLLRRHFPVERVEPAVDLIRLVMGSDARFLRCALDSGARGIVLEAFGRGNGTPPVNELVREAVAGGVPVLVASRCPQGRVMPVYGAGGGKDLERAGAIFAGDLTGLKARILLAVLLGGPRERELADIVASAAG